MKKKISYEDFLKREYDIYHAPIDPEMDFYNAIKTGDIKKVKSLLKDPLSGKKGLGTLSNDPLQNMKYHFTIATASVARACIGEGFPLSEAFNLSDYYIQQVDKIKSLCDIDELHDEMCLTYTKKMKEYNKRNVCSKPIIKCIDYIYENLNTRITLPNLCEITGLSGSYLSRLFKTETGCTLSSYILRKKLETAVSMLSYSDYTIAEISAALAFPSQSYFTNAIKKEYGTTPLNIRKNRRK